MYACSVPIHVKMWIEAGGQVFTCISPVRQEPKPNFLGPIEVPRPSASKSRQKLLACHPWYLQCAERVRSYSQPSHSNMHVMLRRRYFESTLQDASDVRRHITKVFEGHGSSEFSIEAESWQISFLARYIIVSALYRPSLFGRLCWNTKSYAALLCWVTDVCYRSCQLTLNSIDSGVCALGRMPFHDDYSHSAVVGVCILLQSTLPSLQLTCFSIVALEAVVRAHELNQRLHDLTTRTWQIKERTSIVTSHSKVICEEDPFKLFVESLETGLRLLVPTGHRVHQKEWKLLIPAWS